MYAFENLDAWKESRKLVVAVYQLLDKFPNFEKYALCDLKWDFKTTRQLDNKKNMERTIENLYIWEESRVVVNLIYQMLMDNRDYGFKDQIQRAPVSIMNNIAEGFESGSDAKFVNFLNIAKGSCSEVRSMLYLCEDLQYCTPETRIDLQSQVKKISTGIVKMIETLNNKTTRQ